MVGTLCLTVVIALACGASANEALPDELTLNVGSVENVGSNVVLVLKKRSVRSDDYKIGMWSPDGFKEIDPFPVRTYRGHVEGDPTLQLNANIEPGGILNANISAGRHFVATITGLKVDVGGGESTPLMSAGNKIVPLNEVRTRKVPTPGGYLVPPQPMRRTMLTVSLAANYVAQLNGDLETAVSRAEQSFNDADFVYARDIGIAWELNTLVVDVGPECGKAALHNLIYNELKRPDGIRARLDAHSGNGSHGGGAIFVGGTGTVAGPLLHEAGHQFGCAHHLDFQDAMMGCWPVIGPVNTQYMIRNIDQHDAEGTPAVVYNGVLPPRALNDFANTRKDTPVTIDVLENDYDGNGDTMVLKSVDPRGAKGGSVALSEDGKQVVYTPAPGFVGQDTFAYTIVDSTGAGNRTGRVTVDVRTEGLAVHLDFENPERDGIQWMRDTGHWKTWLYDYKDRRPADQKFTYHFRNLGPYGERGTAHWIEAVPVKGVIGNGILNPVGGHGWAQVECLGFPDPGRWSLSASVWVLFPQAVHGQGVIMCKGAIAYAMAISWVNNGWAMGYLDNGQGFKFMGNVARADASEVFELHTEEPIKPDTWYHLAMVIDRDAGKLRAWVNNNEVLTSGSQPDIPDGPIASEAPLLLFNGFSRKRWRAGPLLMDEVKIFTSALTEKQVAELYAEGKDAKVPTFPELQK